MNYVQRLQQSKDSKDASKSAMNARESAIQLAKDTLDAEKRKVAAEGKVDTLKGQFPINTAAILEAQYEAEAAEQNFFDLLTLGNELFPDNISVREDEISAPKTVAKKIIAKTAVKRK